MTVAAAGIGSALARITAASLAMGGLLVALRPLTAGFGRVTALALLVAAGLVSYVALAFAFRLHLRRRI